MEDIEENFGIQIEVTSFLLRKSMMEITPESDEAEMI